MYKQIELYYVLFHCMYQSTFRSMVCTSKKSAIVQCLAVQANSVPTMQRYA